MNKSPPETEMKKQFATLQRNLNDINTKLARLHALPPSEDRRRLAADIASLFVFVSTLLSAESSSSDHSNSRHLHHFAERLAQLHEEFTQGDHHSEIHSLTDTCHDGGAHHHSAMVDGGGSESCSCSDGDGGGDDGSDGGDDDGGGGVTAAEFGTTASEESPGSGLAMVEVAETRPGVGALMAVEGGGRLRRCCRRMMVIGAVTTVITMAVVSLWDRSSDFDYFGGRSGYVIPT